MSEERGEEFMAQTPGAPRSDAALDRMLRARLYRADCPDPRILGELTLDVLDHEDILTVRGHLALCPHCSDEVATLAAVLRGDPMEDLRPVPGRLRRVVARLLLSAAPGVALSGVRGADADRTSTYEAEGMVFSFAVAAEERGAGRRWTLLGLVVDEVGDQPQLAGAPMRVRRDGVVVAEGVLDELDNVVVVGLEAGRYDVELDLSDRVVVVENIRIGAEPAHT